MKNVYMIIDEFLDLYKELEEILKNRGIKNGRSSMVMQFISSPECRPFKDDLNTCREIRNILTHCPNIDGVPPLIPSESSINTLKRVIKHLSAPPLAIDRAVKSDEMLCARLSDRVVPIMHKMTDLGFSHIPVFKNGLLFGVFSISSVFSMALESDGDPVTNKTTIKDFIKYLPIENHICESFVFAPKDTTESEAESMLENSTGPLRKRPAAIFITNNGSPRERILGMVTPWDLLGSNN